MQNWYALVIDDNKYLKGVDPETKKIMFSDDVLDSCTFASERSARLAGDAVRDLCGVEFRVFKIN